MTTALPALPPTELTDLRAVQTAALPDTAVISRLARTYDDTGGYSDVATVIATVACRVTHDRPREVQQGATTVVLAEWVITLPYGTAVQADDEIAVGDSRYHVVGTLTGSWRTAERALCTGY